MQIRLGAPALEGGKCAGAMKSTHAESGGGRVRKTKSPEAVPE